MGSHGKALAVSFFRRRARLRSRANDFHYSIEKRYGKLERYVSFHKIHVLYYKVRDKNTTLHYHFCTYTAKMILRVDLGK